MARQEVADGGRGSSNPLTPRGEESAATQSGERGDAEGAAAAEGGPSPVTPEDVAAADERDRP